jgi:hypothetical protein
MIRILFISASLALAAPAPALAADQLKVAPTGLDPTRGYVLVRLGERGPKVWNFMSIAAYDEKAEDLAGKGRAKASPVPKGADKAVVIREKPFLAEADHVRTHLVALTPGRYVIASSPTTCFCLGSYSFEVQPGKVTDLGHVYIGAENGSSPWAALSKLHSSPDIEARGYTVADAMAIVPAKADTPVPAELAALPRVPAEFKPVRRFGNHSGQLINRALPLEAK